MEDGGGGSAKQGGERFDGRVNGLSVTDLKLGYQNRLQLLRSRRSATAATLNDEDKFAVLLDLCTGDAYHVLQDRFRERLEANAVDREKTEAKNREVEEGLAAKWHADRAEGREPGPVPAWPRLVPKGDSTLMAEAWDFLQVTYPEHTAQSLSDYLNFKHVPHRSTHATFHVLRELCRRNGKPVIGREITEKALKYLRPEVRRAIEGDVLKWGVSDCTLTRLEADARQVEDALHTRELGASPASCHQDGDHQAAGAHPRQTSPQAHRAEQAARQGARTQGYGRTAGQREAQAGLRSCGGSPEGGQLVDRVLQLRREGPHQGRVQEAATGFWHQS